MRTKMLPVEILLVEGIYVYTTLIIRCELKQLFAKLVVIYFKDKRSDDDTDIISSGSNSRGELA